MARGRFPDLLIPLLILNFALFMVVLGISGWALDSFIDGRPTDGNSATEPLVLFSLIAGAVGVASIIIALSLVRGKSRENATGSSTSAIIAWVLLIIAFGLACKQIHIGNLGTTLKFLEAFVIIVMATHSLYLLVLHADELGL
ncbi:hypothetical protein GOP47_0009462 [Adiantum capillus-veneris]|uniref:Uncharacterized protein n=1 Tax=Adiantum capillus-veneris TaxID=13818 RepID=A0A9D4ZJJ1_ADICA|nr:hypothetical protein GOP47_0009462 [Adiantum capillus-veneris]